VVCKWASARDEQQGDATTQAGHEGHLSHGQFNIDLGLDWSDFRSVQATISQGNFLPG
jgi:hypothetical protein